MSTEMRTAVLTAPGRVEIQRCPLPTATGTHLLVKIEACALCTWEQRVFAGKKEIAYPFIGGHEMVGTVVQLGEKVDADLWKVGDRVAVGVLTACGECAYCKSGREEACCNLNHGIHNAALPHKGMGGLSEYLLVEPRNLFPYGSVPASQGALIEPLSCVLLSVEAAQIAFGDLVVVIGCGFMGMLHLELARMRGAKVIAVDIDPKRLGFAQRRGGIPVNSKTQNVGQIVRNISPVGADVVFDTTPLTEVAAQSLTYLAPGGRAVYYSSVSPDEAIPLNADWVHKKNVRIIGAANSNSGGFIRASRLISRGILDVSPYVSETYPFDEVDRALKSAARGDRYRVVVLFGEAT